LCYRLANAKKNDSAYCQITLVFVFIIIVINFLKSFYTPGSKGPRGLKTKVKNVAGMDIGPGNRC